MRLIVTGLLLAAGIAAWINAVLHERRMHRHRKPGVSYKDATLRWDGAWRRADVFTDVGLAHQKKASLWGVVGAALLVGALVMLVVG